MRLLLDSHIIVWWLADSPRLKRKIRQAIADSNNEALVSAASVWELALKVAGGKLQLPQDFLARLRKDGFGDLEIRADHALEAARLPLHHRDPFDRLLVAQARAEKLVLVTQDENVARYDVPLLNGD